MTFVGFTFGRGAEEAFLADPALQSLVSEAVEKLGEHFGSNVRISLVRSCDEGDLLSLVAASTMSATEASSRLVRFYEEWWLDNVARDDDKLHVSLDLW